MVVVDGSVVGGSDVVVDGAVVVVVCGEIGAVVVVAAGCVVAVADEGVVGVVVEAGKRTESGRVVIFDDLALEGAVGIVDF